MKTLTITKKEKQIQICVVGINNNRGEAKIAVTVDGIIDYTTSDQLYRNYEHNKIPVLNLHKGNAVATHLNEILGFTGAKKNNGLMLSLSEADYTALKTAAEETKETWLKAEIKKAMSAKIIGYKYEIGCDCADTNLLVYSSEYFDSCFKAQKVRNQKDATLAAAIKNMDLVEFAKSVGAQETEGGMYCYGGYEFNAEQVQILIARAHGKVVETKQAEKKQQVTAEIETKIETVKNMTAEDIACEMFSDRVHVDEDGHFSECEDWCDDCIWITVWKKDVPADVRAAAGSYTVYGRNEKAYIYRVVDDASKALFAKNHDDLLEAARAEKTTNLQKCI
ncbi:MAG: hypothetical protein PHW12_08530 [Smithella sp.]|nr:hypothetical protein [Smithella sp.]